jgi:hypothetical protein
MTTSISLHPTPHWQSVAREQLRAVRTALWKEGVIFLAALGLLGAAAIGAAVRAAGDPRAHMDMSYEPEASVLVALVGLFIPFGVWRSEDPARRSYHWAMPVPRGPHTLTKAAAGWLWLMAAVAVYVLFIAVLAAAVAQITGEPQGDRSVSAWEWAVPFTSASVAYLLGSTAVLRSEHPWRWIGGLTIAYFAGLAFTDALDVREAEQMVERIVGGYYGMQAALFGHLDAAGRRPSAERWLGATLLWGAIGAVGVGLAAYWYRDA